MDEGEKADDVSDLNSGNSIMPHILRHKST